MANNTFTLTTSGNANHTLTGITINSVLRAIGPFSLDVTVPGIATAIQTALNALGLGTFTVTIVSTNFVIACACTPNTLNSITYYSAGTPSTVNFTPTTCGAVLACTDVTATITGTLVVSCANGLVFTDTTGAYSAINTGGYGAPNAPAISDLRGTQFKLYDSTGSVLIDTFNSNYIPDASGTVGVTLTPANFGLTVFNPGVTYTLTYGLLWASGPSTCLVDTFTYPCCGAQIPSNLTVSDTITEAVGNASLTFTDTTGVYNSTTNPGGYGTPNPNYSDITSTLIVITLEGGTVINFTTFIPTALVPTLVITAAQLGYNNTIPDQIIQVQYYVYTGVSCQVGYSNQFILLYGNSQACINAQIQGLLAGTCTCNDENCSSTDYITGMLFRLDAIKIAAQSNMACIRGAIQSYYLQCSGGCTSCSNP